MAVNVDFKNLTDAQAAWMAAVNSDIASIKDGMDNLTGMPDFIEGVVNRQYGYNHIAKVSTTLEEDYNTIIAADQARETPIGLVDKTAIGLVVVLYSGDNIPLQQQRLFINTTEEENPNGYTFTEASDVHFEIVKAWYFIEDSSETLLQPDGQILKIIEYTRNTAPNLATNFYDNAYEIIYDTRPSQKPINVKKQCENIYSTTLTDTASLSNEIVEYANITCTTIPSGLNIFSGKKYLKKVSFPNTEVLGSTNGKDGIFYGCNALEEYDFPKLKTIQGITNSTSPEKSTPFSGVKKAVFPVSVEHVKNGAFSQYGIIETILVLNCKDATFDEKWCTYGPKGGFEMCSDWGASINIVKACENLPNIWDIQKYITLLNTKLRDMTLINETRTLTIPSTKLTELQADTNGAAAIAAAEAKGWQVQGG